MGLIEKNAVVETLMRTPGVGIRVVDRVRAMPEVDRWVPVTERLPEEPMYYLTTVKDIGGFRRVEEAMYNAELGCFGIYEKMHLDDGTHKTVFWPSPTVIAWMEKPEPWRGEEVGNETD